MWISEEENDEFLTENYIEGYLAYANTGGGHKALLRLSLSKARLSEEG